MSIDTSRWAAAVQARIHAQMAPSQRLELAFEMTVVARELAFARIRQDNPGCSERQVVHAYLREMAARENLTIVLR